MLLGFSLGILGVKVVSLDPELSSLRKYCWFAIVQSRVNSTISPKLERPSSSSSRFLLASQGSASHKRVSTQLYMVSMKCVHNVITCTSHTCSLALPVYHVHAIQGIASMRLFANLLRTKYFKQAESDETTNCRLQLYNSVSFYVMCTVKARPCVKTTCLHQLKVHILQRKHLPDAGAVATGSQNLICLSNITVLQVQHSHCLSVKATS